MQGEGPIGGIGTGEGVIHMAARDVFEWLRTSPDERSVRVSYVEIFNEEVRDLLADGADSVSTAIAALRAVRVVDSMLVNARERDVDSYGSLMGVLAEGEKNRLVAATKTNGRSSRSHTFLRLILESASGGEEATWASTPGGGRGVSLSILTLVDLAGSESTKKTKETTRASGSAFTHTLRLDDLTGKKKGGGRINESLLVILRVINSLGGTSGGDKPPFRESKLTQLLKPSLSAESGVAMIFCATPWTHAWTRPSPR